MAKFKKYIAAVLVIASMLSMLPQVIAVEEDAIRILTGTEVTVSLAGGTTVEVETTLTDTLHWQIYAPAYDVWADISGKTGAKCDVNYAMVCNSLNTDGVAMIRCRAGETYSDAIMVSVDHSAQYVSAAPVALTEAAEAAEAAADAEEPVATAGNCIVEVQFLYYTTQQPAAASWTASVPIGQSETLEVQVPTVLGYAPYYHGQLVTGNTLTITTGVLEGDTTYVVHYQSADVQYTVIHHQQNVDNDSYIPVLTEQLMGPTDSLVGMVEKDYAGFTALLYEHPTIAADGSTVVDVYYDREYYLMNFDLGEGGYGVYPIYARYETAVNVSTPIRAGYTFLGWEPALPVTVPAENSSYTAVWQAATEAQVSIVIWGENPNDEGYSYLQSFLYDAQPGEVLSYGATGLTICGQAVHQHDEGCIYDCGKEAHSHDADCCTLEEHIHSAENGCTLDCDHTSHTYECYGGTSEETPDDYLELINAASVGLISGSIYHVKYASAYIDLVIDEHYYLYYEGAWYKAAETDCQGNSLGDNSETSWGMTRSVSRYEAKLSCAHDHTDACYNCDKSVHDHTSGCVYCSEGLEAHQHDESCYNCDMGNHEHDDNCYEDVLSSRVDSTLYYYVKGDTVTVEADGSTVLNVYYDRREFTMTFQETSDNGGDTIDTITAKWGADIRDRFQTISNANTFMWSQETDGSSPWTSFVNVMPKENRTYYARRTTSSNIQSATYYGEVIGETDKETVVIEGTTYEVLYTTTVKYGSDLTVSEEEFEEIEGYAFNAGISTKENATYDGAKFYYKRQEYQVDFNDGFKIVQSAQVKFEEPLAGYDFVPDVPAAYDASGYEFGGWYLNPECTGERFDLTTETMKAEKLVLYAKWKPKTHTVKFYRDNTLSDELGSYTVLHNTYLTEYPEDVTNGSYEFLYWFYMNGSVEQAFDPDNMAIFQDMVVYAKWSSNTLRPYIIHYTTAAGESIGATTVWVADLSEGSGLAGTTKTFEAKGPEALYDGYQHGYFPTTRTHSFVLSLEGENEYTFVYKKKESVPYTVRYVDAETNLDLLDPVTVSDNKHAVVTETSIAIAGYRADAYQKKLIVVAEETDTLNNEIIFYYTKLAEGEQSQDYYRVSHYTQTLNGGWMEYQYKETTGIVGETYTQDPIAIPGFTYDASISTPEGELTLGGIHLKLFYTRNSYKYVVRYLNVADTNNPLLESISGYAKYESVVRETAPDIDGYEIIGESSHSITIRQDVEDPRLNVITFYYQEQTDVFNYVVIGPDGCGTVSPETETVYIQNGSVIGSEAVANHGYRFVGWYKDIDCTEPVNAADGTLSGNRFIPAQKDGVYSGRTYYAKFEYDLTTLTISKTGAENIDEGQSFLFRIYSEEQGIDVTVAIVGNSSVTITELPVGTYRITELTGWSWRYTPDVAEKEVSVVGGQENSISFANSRSGLYWLDGNDNRENNFN